jgi:hypothetical protein
MTSQTPEELDDQLLEAIDLQDNTDADDVMKQIAPALGAIRRHAAADALRAQADRLGKLAAGYIKLAAAEPPASDNADMYNFSAIQCRTDGRMLRRAADEIIAEGWEHTCAQTTPATREDPAYGCETRVENEGDYCPRHEPADDYDPREDD